MISYGIVHSCGEDITDTGLSPLWKSLLKLKSLNLNLNGSNITDKTLTNIGKALELSASLESLNLDVSK